MYISIYVCKAEYIFITWVAGVQKMAAELNSIRFSIIGEDNVSIFKGRQEQLRIVQGRGHNLPNSDRISPYIYIRQPLNQTTARRTHHNTTVLNFTMRVGNFVGRWR